MTVSEERPAEGWAEPILDTAAGSLIKMLTIKAEEAGCELIVLNTRKHKPSQTYPCCGWVRKKSLSEQEHH